MLLLLLVLINLYSWSLNPSALPVLLLHSCLDAGVSDWQHERQLL
jgi:fermentation-respiration switch protein FrsA (DUF1100 family)